MGNFYIYLKMTIYFFFLILDLFSLFTQFDNKKIIVNSLTTKNQKNLYPNSLTTNQKKLCPNSLTTNQKKLYPNSLTTKNQKKLYPNSLTTKNQKKLTSQVKNQTLTITSYAFLSCLSSFRVQYSDILGVEEPYQSIPNWVVKFYCGVEEPHQHKSLAMLFSRLSSLRVQYSSILGVEEPHQSILNLVVKF